MMMTSPEIMPDTRGRAPAKPWILEVFMAKMMVGPGVWDAIST
jgi:hypothetical protein